MINRGAIASPLLKDFQYEAIINKYLKRVISCHLRTKASILFSRKQANLPCLVAFGENVIANRKPDPKYDVPVGKYYSRDLYRADASGGENAAMDTAFAYDGDERQLFCSNKQKGKNYRLACITVVCCTCTACISALWLHLSGEMASYDLTHMVALYRYKSRYVLHVTRRKIDSHVTEFKE